MYIFQTSSFFHDSDRLAKYIFTGKKIMNSLPVLFLFLIFGIFLELLFNKENEDKTENETM